MLLPPVLENRLLDGWLEARPFPQSNVESGQWFATAVVTWFSSATALAFPCLTAFARQPQLANQAAQALTAGAPMPVGSALGQAVAAYISGQMFGPGVAGMSPLAAPCGQMVGAVLSDLQLSTPERARRMTVAFTVLAMTTMVSFPTPPFPPQMPVT